MISIIAGVLSYTVLVFCLGFIFSVWIDRKDKERFKEFQPLNRRIDRRLSIR